jgi:hypothetical protein
MLEFNLVNAAFAVLLAIFVAHWFGPVQWLKHKLNLERWEVFYLYNPLNCSKCLSFWLSLALFHSLTYAMILSIVTYLLDFVLTLVERILHD